MQVKVISTLKTVILNQQHFIESSQRTLIAKNLMITGIPNDDIKWGDRRYIDEKEKVLAILDAIDVSLVENNYEIFLFAHHEKLTSSTQLISSNFEKKKTVLEHAKQLRECATN